MHRPFVSNRGRGLELLIRREAEISCLSAGFQSGAWLWQWLVVLGTRPNPLSARGIVARGFRNRGGGPSRRSRPDSASEGESEAKREGRRMAIARFYRAIRARGIRNRHSLAKHVVLGTSDGPAGGGGGPWYQEPLVTWFQEPVPRGFGNQAPW